MHINIKISGMDGEVATKSREVSRYSRYMMMVMTSPGMNFV